MGFLAKVPIIDVNSVIEENLKLWLDKIRKANIKMELSLENNLPEMHGDSVQFQQVINNLVLNAVEAIGKDGVISISTCKRQSSITKKKDIIAIEIEDTNSGIDPKDIENIFNPFFTTKTTGTGLGLAICHKIVERHGGIILVDSKQGEGAVFTVELPI